MPQPKPFDITTLEVPYGRSKILKAYEDADFHKDETCNDIAYTRHFLPLVTAQQKDRPRPVTKEVQGIYRLKDKGKEYLIYHALFRGTDWKRNEVNFSMLMGRYQLPKFRYEIDPNTNEVITEKTQVQGLDTVYDIPFSKEKAKELIDMSVTGFPTLVIIDPVGGKKYSCLIDEFIKEEFDVLISQKTGLAQYLEERESNNRKK
jgi:hypothetical protein